MAFPASSLGLSADVIKVSPIELSQGLQVQSPIISGQSKTTLGSSSSTPRSLVFVDSGVIDATSLLAHSAPGTEVFYLNAVEDAVTQITRKLLDYSGLSSLHILSHGTSGGLTFAQGSLTAENLGQYTNQIKSWSQALSTDADILLYGCDVAGGVAGAAFIRELGQLSHADIAASTNITGSGGDWILEATTGTIESALISDVTGRSQYRYSLDSAVQLLSNSNALLASDAVGGDLGDRSVSADGRFVVFSSAASTLVPGDTNGKKDVFLYDRNATTNAITLISHVTGVLGQPSNGDSTSASISSDGNFVIFSSTGNNLTADTKTGSANDLFRWKRSDGSIDLISKVTAGTGNGNTVNAVISGNGSTIAFISTATNLTGTIADTNGSTADLFLWTAGTGQVTLIDKDNNNEIGDLGVGDNLDISNNGRFVAFNSQSQLTSLDRNLRFNDIYVYDVTTQILDLVSTNGGVTNEATTSVSPSVRYDETTKILRVLFSSNDRLTANDSSFLEDIYVAEKNFTDPNNLDYSPLRLVSRTAGLEGGTGATNGNGSSSGAVLSGNGRYVAFTSKATNLVTGDVNGVQDVFLHDLDAPDPTSAATRLISRNSAAGSLGDGDSRNISINEDGSIVAFTSIAKNLVNGVVANDLNAEGEDVFAYDRIADTLTLVTRKTGATTSATLPNGGAFGGRSISRPIVAGVGASKTIIYANDAIDLVLRDSNGRNDIFAFDLTTSANTLLTKVQSSQNSSTGSGNSTLQSAGSVSRDGRYAVFTSVVSSLVTGDNNAAADIFIRDTTLPTTNPAALKLVSRTVAGASGNQTSSQPFISADGKYVVFTSVASDLVATDTNAQQDVFLYEVATGTVSLVSKTLAAQGDGASGNATVAIDAGGEVYVSFLSRSGNFGATGTGTNNVFVWKKSTGIITLVSKSTGVAGGNLDSSTPIISADGKYIAFTSNSTNLTTTNFTGTDTNNAADVFIYDIAGATLKLVSQNAGTIGNNASFNPVISDTNGIVAFESRASNLTAIVDGNAVSDIFRYDGTSNSLISVNAAGNAAGNQLSTGANISADGNVVAFTSEATNLSDTTDTNAKSDVFVRTLGAVPKTTLISRSRLSNTASNGQSDSATLSSDGQLVAFLSTSTDLSTQDTSPNKDVFTSTITTPNAKLISTGTSGNSNSDSAAVSLSRDGGVVVFESNASNLIALDDNNASDIFSRPTRPIVSFKVVDAAASEGTTDTGTYEISRSDSSGSLDVKLKLSDLAPLTDATIDDVTFTADLGATVTVVAGIITVKIPDGIAKVTLTLTAIVDLLTEGSENAILNLQTDSGYTVDPVNTTGTVVIAPNGTIVTNTLDRGVGSLRQAIANARLTPGPDTITFALTNPALKTITLLTALDDLNGNITIDGGTSGVILNGATTAAGTNGLRITGSGNVVKGITVTGFTGNGILIEGSDNTIGGTIAGNGNTVNANKLGVYVKSGTGNQILGNAITNNTDLGIDINPIGPAATDSLILITASATPTGATVTGTLAGTPGTYRVEFFSNATTDSVGRTEGETYLGFQDVTIAAGATTAIVSYSSTIAGLANKYISATVTDAAKNTSEFVKDLRVTTPLPIVSLSSAEAITGVAEGNTGITAYKFNVKLSTAPTANTIFNYRTVAVAGPTGATAGTDYTSVTTGTVTVLAGSDTAVITIDIKGDTRFEVDKSFEVELFGIDTATYASGTIKATGIIKNDDLRPTISFESNAVSIAEGQTAPNPQLPFKINLSNESDEAITVSYETVDGPIGTTGAISTGTAKDFTAISPTVVTFAPGELSKTISVEIIADTIVEAPETFTLRLSAPTNASFAAAATTLDAIGTILPDEQPYVFSVVAVNPTILEGPTGGTNIAKFTVTIDQDPQEDLVITYETNSGLAVSGIDFVRKAGTLTFLRGGSRSQTIDVSIIGNDTFQGDRDFDLRLLEPSARISIDPTKASATTLIKEDDFPKLSFKVGTSGDIRGVEGGPGSGGSASIIVELSEVSNKDVTVEFTTLDGTATALNNDYIPRTTPGQKITIQAGQKSTSVNFGFIGDDVIEPDETFFVKLSNPIGATIFGSDTQAIIIEDDDARIAAQPQISISAVNATQTEGNTGTKDFTFAVTLSRAPQAGTPVSVTVVTTDGSGNNSATAIDNDYSPKTQVITFNPGDPLTKQFIVQVNGDTKVENTETFGVTLRNAVNGIVLTQSAIGTIIDDDTPVGVKPIVSITPITLTQNEGNTGTTPFTFRVTLDKAPALGETVSVDVATIDGTATSVGGTAGIADFAAQTRTFTFTSTGALTQDFTVFVNGDTQPESNETFTVELRNAIGATLSSNAIAAATIKDDDTPIVTQPRISVSPITLAQNEGNSGTTPFTFRITLDKAPEVGSQVSVDVATVDGAGSTGAISTGSSADFAARTQTFTFTSTGALTQDFTVFVNGDTQVESNETFTVELRNAIGGVLETPRLTATITNDDSTTPGARNNISADSLNDILWRNPVTGETLLWQTNLGPTTRATTIPNTYDPAIWRYGGTADFNKDGSPDFLWHNIQTGEVIIWKVNGNRIEAFINPTINQLGGPLSVPGDWHIEDVSDYTLDSKPDILWRNYRTNQIVVWEMDGLNFTNFKSLSQPISLDWNVEAVADFTGVGSKSLLWRNKQSGNTVLWKIAGEQWINGTWSGLIDLRTPVQDRNWQIVTTGDMNGDRISDVLWQNTATGEAVVWYMGSTGVNQIAFLPKPTSGFQIKATGDFNRDGVTDLYLQNRLTGQNQIWYLQQTAAGIDYGSTVLLPNTLPGNQFLGTGTNTTTGIPTLIWRNTLNRELVTWQISPSSVDSSTSINALSDPDIRVLWTGDLDGTGRSKVLTRNQQNGIVEVANLNNGIYNKVSNLLPIDRTWAYRGMGDANGDGVKDIFWQNLETGKVEIWKLGGNGYAPVLTPQTIPGADWVINQVADFNGDGLADIFWRNSRTNQTSMWLMDGATVKDAGFLPTLLVDWQIINVADFDRNGTSDFLWRNTLTGQVVTWLLDGKSIKKITILPTVTDSSWSVKSVADYDRDGNPDLLWYNTRTKQSVFWKMKDGQYESSVLLPEVPNSAWDLVGTRDFNGDGNLDLLWLNTATGTPTIWYLDKMKYAAAVTLPNLPNPNFKVIGLDDFNQIPT